MSFFFLSSQQSASASSERKPSNDLSAEEYYNIYLNSKKSVRNKKLQFERGGSFKTEKVTSENTVQVVKIMVYFYFL